MEQGADANEADRSGLVPLYHAIGIKGKPEIMSLLIQHGANVNAVHRGTVSMLDHARNSHDAAKEKLLLEHGAKTAAELKEQQNFALPEAEPEQPEKAARLFPVLPTPSAKASSSLKGMAAGPSSCET
ncbi:hypothetical protein [Akkermansia sp.]|uniref:hypothetical protein n=1 Tax=Akkermansia sp. TaxID=1872421 RepID=UPI0025BA746B|nr:hypothetical protein [Akkermansia sp.]MCD8065040.1 hypothetical protein [Akkermansia sp.]